MDQKAPDTQIASIRFKKKSTTKISWKLNVFLKMYFSLFALRVHILLEC